MISATRRLKDAGFGAEQAEAVVQTVTQANSLTLQMVQDLADLKNMVSRVQFEETVARLATRDDIRNMATRDEISGLVTEAWLSRSLFGILGAIGSGTTFLLIRLLLNSFTRRSFSA